jgi:AcrR family transcriptional regulator
MDDKSIVDARAQILFAAEQCFAESGFGGASIRMIAELAGVNPALIHYYFQTKDELYRETVKIRATKINAARRERILMLFAEAAPRLPSIESVIDAILRPTIELGRGDDPGGQFHLIFVNAAANSVEERDKEISANFYDSIAKECIVAIRRILKNINLEDATWGYLTAIAMAYAVTRADSRAGVLTQGACDQVPTEEVISSAVTFICAGLRGLDARQRKSAHHKEEANNSPPSAAGPKGTRKRKLP